MSVRLKCTLPGCEKLQRAGRISGFCGMHITRIRAHGDPNYNATFGPRLKYAGKTYRERLMGEVEMVPESGCWLHKGQEVGRGYAMRGNSERAHRAFYREFVGHIPAGLVVAHKCDVPCCVNPKHLFACTQQENIDDRTAKNRQAKGMQTGAAKLRDDDVREIRKKLSAGYRYGLFTALGKRFGVDRAVIARIHSGRSWSHVA